MIAEIKKALKRDEPRTASEATDLNPDANDTDRGSPDVSESDPFRPPVDLVEDTDEDRIGMDQLFEILRNQRRRYVLAYLSMADGTVTLSDLAEQIAAWECDKEITQLDSQERKRVYVGLYQCHLPKMDDVSAISYNQPRGKIERGEQFEAFKHYLRREV